MDEVEKLRLIDISSEDDFLIASPSEEQLRFSGNFPKVENAADIFGQWELESLPSESLEPERASRIGKCNMRKSLAWDSAFFTSAGVLDPEELSIINKGFKKAKTHLLPGIQEDMWRSAESNSTLDSYGFSLESFEVDLFEDIRASIQKSSKTSNVASSCCKSGLGEAGMQNVHSLKKLDVTSRNKMKSVPAPRIQSINMQGSDRIKKEVSIHPQAVQHATRSGEHNLSSLKPPKIVRRTNPISAAPTKSASSGARHVKKENRTAKAPSGQGLMVSKKPGLGDSCSVIASCTQSPKSSSSVSPTATSDSTVSCSSYSRSGSAPFVKSPSNSLRRKIDSRNAKLAASGSTLKTPLRYSVRNRNELGISSLSSYSLMPKPSFCTSPASSIDGWSSESSASTSTVNQRSNNSKASQDTTPFRGVCLDSHATQKSDMQSHPRDQSYVGHVSQETRLPNQCVKKASMGTSPASMDLARNLKPSGLCKPSPKIGFFDAEKSTVSALNGSLQFHSGVQSISPKFRIGISNLNGAANRTRPGKFQPARTLLETGNMKLGSQQTRVLRPALGIKSRYSAECQELHNASPKGSGTLRTMRNCHGMTSKSETDLSPEMGREHCLKTKKVRARGNAAAELGLGSSLKVEEKGTKGFLKNKMRIKSKRQVFLRANKTSPNKDETDLGSEDINPFRKEHEEACRHHLENDLHLLHRKEKENLFNFEDQVDGLSRHVGAIDLNGNMVIELKGKKGYSHSLFGIKYSENYSAPMSSSFSGEHLLHGQQEDSLNIFSKPSPLSLPSTVEFIPSTRTPLAVKDSICNRSGLFELSTESAIEKPVEKAASTFPLSQRH